MKVVILCLTNCLQGKTLPLEGNVVLEVRFIERILLQQKSIAHLRLRRGFQARNNCILIPFSDTKIIFVIESLQWKCKLDDDVAWKMICTKCLPHHCFRHELSQGMRNKIHAASSQAWRVLFRVKLQTVVYQPHSLSNVHYCVLIIVINIIIALSSSNFFSLSLSSFCLLSLCSFNRYRMHDEKDHL